MELWKKRLIGYWAIAWVFTLIFGEIITGVISNNPTFFQNVIPITLYYGIITFVFSFIFIKTKYWIVLIVLFIYGGLVEVLFFKGILNFVIAGLFYDFLFGVPYLITIKIWKNKVH